MDSSTSGDDFIADFFDLFDLSGLESSAGGEIESKSFGSNKRSFLISLALSKIKERINRISHLEHI